MQDDDSYLYNDYTFNELVLSLKDKYIEQNEILKKLESVISINSEFKTEYRFLTDLKEVDDLDQETDLVLIVTTRVYSEETNKVYSTSYEFKVNVINDTIVFERINSSRYNRIEDFTIDVSNKDLFKEYFNELKNTFFYKANMIDTSIDRDYTLHVDSNEVELVKYLNAGHSISITYNSLKDDQTVFNTGDYDGLNAILNKRIPAAVFPENYQIVIKKALIQEVKSEFSRKRTKLNEK